METGNYLIDGDNGSDCRSTLHQGCELFEADNTIIDEETGKVSVKSPEYSVYGMGVKQKGALTSKVEGELKNASANLTGIDSEKLDEVTGFIKGWSDKNNYDQLLNAATNMKSKLKKQNRQIYQQRQ